MLVTESNSNEMPRASKAQEAFFFICSLRSFAMFPTNFPIDFSLCSQNGINFAFKTIYAVGWLIKEPQSLGIKSILKNFRNYKNILYYIYKKILLKKSATISLRSPLTYIIHYSLNVKK